MNIPNGEWQTPGGEWVVLVPYDSPIFVQYFGIPRQQVTQDVRHWLRTVMGDKALNFENVSQNFPWRHRVWQVNVSHAFFFYTARQAMIFKLRWG